MPDDAFARSPYLQEIASAFAMAGLQDQALDILEETAVARLRDPLSMIAANPMFESLHNTKRWQALMRKNGIEL